MRIPLPPDWVLYAGAVLGVVLIATGQRERADAPAAPPPEDAAPLDPTSPFAAAKTLPAPRGDTLAETGTAFSISDDGLWLTARHVIANCRTAAIIVATGRAARARLLSGPEGDVAVLKTEGGAQPMPLALDARLSPDQRAFHPGFPGGGAGEAASVYLGKVSSRSPVRWSRPQTQLAWAETGRTNGLKGSLAGLSGAPVLDETGRVVGMTLAESPRRGRILAAPPWALREALARAQVEPKGFAPGQVITVDNYGRVADSLRRDLRVAQVACLN
ncbi:MAG: S1 family peptidase [Caulobacteraceae bacterium]